MPASAERQASYTLRVEGTATDDLRAADELFVIDSSFALVKRGVGTLEARLPAGVYKVKSRRAREEREQFVVLDRDRTVRFESTPFASPAPFYDTTLTHETHRDAAARESRVVHVAAGIGARIFLQSRYWTAVRPT